MEKPAPAYEGRPLLRPRDKVADQGLGFDVATLLDRRRALRFLGLGAAGAVLTACSGGSSATTTSASASAASGEIPDETAGPYPGDGSNGPDVLEQSGVVRGDIRSSFGTGSATAEGVPMTLELVVADLAKGGSPSAGVAVYVWHCDRADRYSLYSQGIENENYLRGVQLADAGGRVRFTSIFPACYDGRWPHIHFENVCEAVYAQSGYEQSTANLAKVSLSNDNVFGDDSGALQLATVTGDVTSGYQVTLDVGVDTTTKPSGGAPPAGGQR